MDVTLYQDACENGEVRINLPENWRTEYFGMPGDTMPALTPEQIRNRINRPFGGMKTIRELARGRENAVIVFDDASRGTRLKEIAEFVVEELLAAGIREDQIEFLCALGNHGAMTRTQFVRKLGEEIVGRFCVFNHNPYENNVLLGYTPDGIPVEINREFVESDVRIGIGAITPHPLNGFGGGGKILFPGIASIATTTGNHMKNKYGWMGQMSSPVMRTEIEDMTRMAGEFFKIDVIYNAGLKIIGLFAGEPVSEYYEGIKTAAVTYRSRIPDKKDVIVANANAKVNEADLAILNAAAYLKETGGDIVLVNYCPDGQVVHYFSGPFGRKACGRQWGPMGDEAAHVRRIICLSPYPDKYSTLRFGDVDGKKRVVWVKTWEEAMELLKKDHGEGTEAGIFSDGTIQYFA